MTSINLIPVNDIRGGNDQIHPYNPFPWYVEMRESTPVYYNEKTDMWNVFYTMR